jgi:hypothetical protein
MDQVLNYHPLTAEAWDWSQSRSCGVCNRRSGNVTGFLWVHKPSFVRTIPMMLGTHFIHLPPMFYNLSKKKIHSFPTLQKFRSLACVQGTEAIKKGFLLILSFNDMLMSNNQMCLSELRLQTHKIKLQQMFQANILDSIYVWKPDHFLVYPFTCSSHSEIRFSQPFPKETQNSCECSQSETHTVCRLIHAVINIIYFNTV